MIDSDLLDPASTIRRLYREAAALREELIFEKSRARLAERDLADARSELCRRVKRDVQPRRAEAGWCGGKDERLAEALAESRAEVQRLCRVVVDLEQDNQRLAKERDGALARLARRAQ